jgi:hypothetical protein
MENEMVNAVLNEILAEQKDAAELLEAMEKTVASIAERLEKIDNKLENGDITQLQGDVLLIQRLVAKGMEDLKKVVTVQKADVVRERRYLFFPEHNAREYYGTVLRWVLYIVIATYGYLLASHMVEVGLVK